MLYAGAHYKSMEVEKDFDLKQSKGEFDAHMKIVNVLQEYMHWWIKNVETAYIRGDYPFHMVHFSEG